MSRERIQTQLQSRQIEVHELVYSQLSVSVYRGLYQSLPAAIKVKHASYDEDWSKYEEEILIMLKFDHPGLVKMYDSCWISTENGNYLVIVSEWCTKDLEKDTQQRRAEQFGWTEEELWTTLRTLVSALAYMQEQCFAHRDIKPSNIFLTIGQGVKLGDFGSAVQRRYDYLTVTGTLHYLSPILRQAMQDRQCRIVHNVYKSDTFSLGVTLLTLMSLNHPQLFKKCPVTRAEVEELVVSMQYSEELRRVVMWMVEPDESLRCDFEMLGNYLKVSTQTTTTTVQKLPSLSKSSISPCLSSKSNSINSSPHQRTSHRYPACLRCGSPVQVYIANSELPVRLPCKPKQHLFCSGTCFLVFALNNQKSELKCPACEKEIPKELADLFLSEIKTNRTLSVRGSHKSTSNRGSVSTRMHRDPEVRQCKGCSLF